MGDEVAVGEGKEETLGDRSCEVPGTTAGGQARAIERFAFSQSPEEPLRRRSWKAQPTSVSSLHSTTSKSPIPSPLSHDVSHSYHADAGFAPCLLPRAGMFCCSSHGLGSYDRVPVNTNSWLQKEAHSGMTRHPTI